MTEKIWREYLTFRPYHSMFNILTGKHFLAVDGWRMQVPNQQWKRVHSFRQDKLTNHFNPLIFQQCWSSAINVLFFHPNDFVGKNVGFNISLNRLEDASYFPKSILKGRDGGKVTDYKKVIPCSYIYYWFSSILKRLISKGHKASANRPTPHLLPPQFPSKQLY